MIISYEEVKLSCIPHSTWTDKLMNQSEGRLLGRILYGFKNIPKSTAKIPRPMYVLVMKNFGLEHSTISFCVPRKTPF